LPKVHRNILKLIAYLREHQHPTTVAHMAATGIMNARDASEAAQFGVRHGVIERIRVPHAVPKERVWYRWNGQPLVIGKNGEKPTFDALLTAWGITRMPPQPPSHTYRKLTRNSRTRATTPRSARTETNGPHETGPSRRRSR
jgi:hypothetical protein